MQTMVSHIRLCIRYILNLGIVEGMKLYFQVELFKLKKISLKEFPNPIELRSHTSDILVFREVFLFKSYDVPLNDIKIIVDGGANVGLASIFFKQKFPDCEVYSIEPDSSNFKLLETHVVGIRSIIPVRSALWN